MRFCLIERTSIDVTTRYMVCCLDDLYVSKADHTPANLMMKIMNHLRDKSCLKHSYQVNKITYFFVNTPPLESDVCNHTDPPTHHPRGSFAKV